MAKRLTAHPMAALFPPMAEAEYQELVKDIRENGQREPITLHEKKILDGVNRYRACVEIGVKPKTRRWDGKGSMLNFVIGMNINRRHLETGQRSIIAAKLATLDDGAQKCAPSDVSQNDAAEALNVSRRSVQQATVVLESGAKPVIKAVESSKLSVGVAALVSGLPTQSQMKAMKQATKDGEINVSALKEAVAKIAPKPKPKSGAEVVPVKLRKIAESLYGKLLRCMDKMGVSKKVDRQLDDILKAIRGK